MLAQPAHRPATITAIEILVYVHALVNFLRGLTWVLERHDPALQVQTGLDSTSLLLAGGTLLLAALLYAGIAHDLATGRRAGVWALSVLAGLHIVGALWLVVVGEGAARGDLVLQGCLSAVVLVLLHTSAADRWFGQRHL